MMGEKFNSRFFFTLSVKMTAKKKALAHMIFQLSGIDLIVGLDWPLEKDFNCGGDSLEMKHQTLERHLFT